MSLDSFPKRPSSPSFSSQDKPPPDGPRSCFDSAKKEYAANYFASDTSVEAQSQPTRQFHDLQESLRAFTRCASPNSVEDESQTLHPPPPNGTLHDMPRSSGDPWPAGCRPERQAGSTNPVIIEMFCGSARVTACLRSLGLHGSFGADHIKKSTVAPVKQVDLASPEGQALFMTWLRNPLVSGIFIAPPRGTCSLARNISRFDTSGASIQSPQTLRSHEYPEGLPGLSPKDRSRVTQANRLYSFVHEVINTSHALGHIIVVENPRNSLFWATRWWRSLQVPFSYQAHQACAYGSDRPQWSVLAYTHAAFSAISHVCPGETPEHVHAPWGLLATPEGLDSEETAYPLRLAAAIATAFGHALIAKGWKPPADKLEVDWKLFSLTKARVSAGQQPRASKLPPLVAEHKAVVVMRSHAAAPSLPVSPMERLKDPWTVPSGIDSPIPQVPSDSQLLRSTPLRTSGGHEAWKEHVGELQPRHSCEIAWGIPFTCDEFVAEAVRSRHPKLLSHSIPEVLRASVHRNCKLREDDLVKIRAEWLNKWLERALALRKDEDVLKSNMPNHLRHILQPKRLLVWKEILQEEGYHDLGVFDEVVKGTELTGDVPVTHSFEKVFRPAEITESQLRASAQADRLAAIHSARSSGDREVDDTVYSKTLEEVKAGWAFGPVDSSFLPADAVVSRRFGLKQSDKIRLIDDLSGSKVNLTVQTSESPKPHTTDVIASMTLELLKGEARPVLGKTFDLKSAYKQLGLAESALWASYVAVFNPNTRKGEIFQLLAVPFGATRAVYSFLRVAHSLWWIGCKCLNLMWSNFYDDFVTLAVESNAANVESTVDVLFRLLGWQYATEGAKCKPFDTSFAALGVCVNLRQFPDGYVEFSNTPKRVAELIESINSFLTKGSMSLVEGQRLRGRMQFSDGQLFGRMGRLCMRAVNNHIFSGKGCKIPAECSSAMQRFACFLNTSVPRKIRRAVSDPYLVFTDAPL